MKDIVIERFGALHLAANLAAAGLPARIESKNAKVFTAPAKELEARIKAQAAPAHRQLVSHLADLERAASSGAGTARCCRRRKRPMSPNKIDAVDAHAPGALGDAGDAGRAGL